MAKKRFTDIEIWDREWYMDLSPTHKCLIKYIFDKCDAAGCWKPNWKLASLHINDKVSLHDLSLLPKDQYEVLPNGKIYIPDFIKFQYGTLSEKSPAHNPVFSAIDKNGLSDRVLNRVSDTPKEKEKEKDIDNSIEEGIYNDSGISTMLKIFKIKNPDYPEDKTKDFTALWQIALKIGKGKGLSQEKILKSKDCLVIKSWEKIVDFIVSDKWFSTRALFDLNNEWQRIIQSMSTTKAIKQPKLSDIQI